MANGETRTEDEVERLRNQKELMELKAQIAALRAPWWKKAGLIATVTALGAAVLPMTTAVQEHYRNEREFALQQVKQQSDIALQQSKQEFDIRLAYLDRFESPGHRLQTLRFLIAISTDARLLAWAKEEEKYVQAQLDKIEEELAIVTKKIEQAAPGQVLEDLKKLRDELNTQMGQSTKKPTPTSGPK